MKKNPSSKNKKTIVEDDNDHESQNSSSDNDRECNRGRNDLFSKFAELGDDIDDLMNDDNETTNNDDATNLMKIMKLSNKSKKKNKTEKKTEKNNKNSDEISNIIEQIETLKTNENNEHSQPSKIEAQSKKQPTQTDTNCEKKQKNLKNELPTKKDFIDSVESGKIDPVLKNKANKPSNEPNKTNDRKKLDVKSDENENGARKPNQPKIKPSNKDEPCDKSAPASKKQSKAVVAKMHEALERIKIEEKRRQDEEEMKQRAIEEAEKRQQELARLEAEKKELKKIKEKEKREKLKKEGKLLTKSQKEARIRANLMLESLKERGIQIPSKELIENKKKESNERDKNKNDIENKPKFNNEEVQITEEPIAKECQKNDQNGIKLTNIDETCSVNEDWLNLVDSEIDNNNKLINTCNSGNSLSNIEKLTNICEGGEKISSASYKKKLRAPVVCVMGHVDTGKTKILDKLRNTHVQEGEAGGITQQIGATNVPDYAVNDTIKNIIDEKFKLKIDGLLIIDTPGHESFRNLRTRGSSLCDLAILVVDIMHGLEPQTIESIDILLKKRTPFIVALNKIDRLYGWVSDANKTVYDSLSNQLPSTLQEFNKRFRDIVGEFAGKNLNVTLFNQNTDPDNYISVVPTSAVSGDGMADLVYSICQYSQTRLKKRLTIKKELEATVMEVKSMPGLGTTIDVILVNGCIKEGDTIVLAGIDGPIVTNIRSLLTPKPMKELRVKCNNYTQHKCIDKSQGFKISAKDLEKAVAGSPLLVVEHDDDVEKLKLEVEEFISSTLKSIKVTEHGVHVQASTLGSLEALVDFLTKSKIPYSSVNIGPVHKKDIIRASVQREHNPLYAVVLAFDVKVESEAQLQADKDGVKIFTAQIIYHLFDKFIEYTTEYKLKKKEEFRSSTVFPCIIRILPQHIFNTRDPIIVGVNIESGTLLIGTPICVPSKDFINVGVVSSIEANHKNLQKAVKGQEVCIKIENTSGETPKLYERHFNHEDLLYSKISRESIDVLKEYFRDEMTKADWQLIIEMKKTFNIV